VDLGSSPEGGLRLRPRSRAGVARSHFGARLCPWTGPPPGLRIAPRALIPYIPYSDLTARKAAPR
jgi:hypothetical protein